MLKPNAIGWFDIYVDHLDRATKFYEEICNQKLEDLIDPTGETKMKVFTGEMNTYGSSGALVLSNHYKPGKGGTLVYFSVEDCELSESKIEKVGGKIIRPKFSIGNFGFVTLCEDSEGNLIGLNSMK
ncbi:VOC family protein [Leptospira kanakyensis]|uniref:VOC family protein n=1 Tax=Leptospira kanakyensis TaxID=2484968 RepID=A0A6N4PZ18_9LEPT|nr:VOC family protein [Leptospira kanakyensis]TGK50201.1 VOC family protein [Leptospira kanakyensis]TGK64198.1 VOC family protein [Leptospira kanakyensis]TGK69339.1 VOC family protein [Leptospira kanakyensis]